MDFTYTPEQEHFRAEIRRWLAANLTDDLRIEDPTDERVAPDRDTFERRREWQRCMYAAGWVGISWPREYGGRDEDLGRGDQLPAGRMVLPDPHLVIAQVVHPLDQLHVAVHRERGVLADLVEGREEYAELHAFVSQYRLRGQGIARREIGRM